MTGAEQKEDTLLKAALNRQQEISQTSNSFLAVVREADHIGAALLARSSQRTGCSRIATTLFPPFDAVRRWPNSSVKLCLPSEEICLRLRHTYRNCLLFSLLLIQSLAGRSQSAPSAPAPWPIRVVIVTTFEIGADTGDMPGELQLWVEREHLEEVLPFPGGVHPLRTNKDHTVLAMLSGTTLVNATASLMALGLDPRFDLTHAYVLINGIAGVDPADASIGSAAWARFVVGDVARYIDPHDAPPEWPYGFFPIGAHAPDPATLPASPIQRSNLYPLNAHLAEWAYAQTRALNLGDDPQVAAYRAGMTGFANAQRPPFVLLGDTFASDTYWHGATTTRWANDWVRLYSAGQGNFVMTEMEDSGFMEAVARLAAMHRVDPQRVMVLRTGSNYSEPRPGHTAVESVTAPYIGTRLAVESAWLCGSTVMHWLLAHWDVAYAHVPGS